MSSYFLAHNRITKLASIQSHDVISVWQMDPKSLAQGSAGDFYSSSAEYQRTHLHFFRYGTIMGQYLIQWMTQMMSGISSYHKMLTSACWWRNSAYNVIKGDGYSCCLPLFLTLCIHFPLNKCTIIKQLDNNVWCPLTWPWQQDRCSTLVRTNLA